MPRKILIALYSLIVTLAIFVLAGGAFPQFGERFVFQYSGSDHTYGDLYRISGLKEFKIKLPLVRSYQTTTLDNSDVIMLGDSFLDTNIESKPLPILLSEATGLSVFYETTIADPLQYLKNRNFNKGKRRILIVETVERAAIDRALNYVKSKDRPEETKTDPFKHFESSIEYFFKNNLIINPLRIALKQINFDLFGRVDPQIGAVSTDPPMLFYADEVYFDNFRKVPMTDIANNIASLRDELKNRYNLELVYLVVPNKYTIYNDLDKNGFYNGFLTGLHDEMNKRNIVAPNLYGEFIERRNNSTVLLYYPNDTHYTLEAKKIVVKKLKDSVDYFK